MARGGGPVYRQIRNLLRDPHPDRYAIRPPPCRGRWRGQRGASRSAMTAFILPLSDTAATDADRVGRTAANLAALARGGLPTPGGFCLTAAAYRAQITALGLDELIERFAASATQARKLSVEIRLNLHERPIAPDILQPLLAAWRAQRAGGQPGVVRSSALIEDRADANFAGQFESFLGLTDETEFLTAVRACWAALWTSNARRYMTKHGLNPDDT